jgi:nitroimidazol reductase NimA-like FMN-containing flavoprotein (pyridoxamine 5'-phosphate oxidase superfamily)
MGEDEVGALIKEHFLCRIAFKGKNYPYIAPFQYVFTNGALYFHFTAYGRKMRLLEKEKLVCVEIEQYTPDMSEYKFVALTGSLSVVRDARERARAITLMREMGTARLSRNFLAAHGFRKDEDWSSFTPEKPLTIVKLEITTKSGLRSP